MNATLTVGDVFKYHNRIVKVVKVTKDTVVGEPYFFDSNIGNLQFNIPIDKIEEINMVNIASKNYILEKLKDIEEGESGDSKEIFSNTDNPISSFDLDQATEAIKVLVDEKSVDVDNFSPNKASKLKQLVKLIAKEIGVSYKIDEKVATNKVTKSIDKRLNSKTEKQTT